jgi:GH24 family phage-related lysozyme (muramidase)
VDPDGRGFVVPLSNRSSRQERAIPAPPPLPSLNRHPEPAHPGRRRQGKLQALLGRLKERRRSQTERLATRARRKKAALAMSVAVMGFGTAAMPAPQTLPPVSKKVDPRRPAALLSASDDLLAAMIQEEGARRTVYRDVAGYPTVGVGHLITPADGLSVGDRVSRDQVLDFLEHDIAEAQLAVTRLVGDLPLSQNEYDALVDLAFNVGEGNLSAERSPGLNAAIAVRDYDAIAAELDYHHAAGRMARGLVYRSERRANIFLDASYADPRPVGGEAATFAA